MVYVLRAWKIVKKSSIITPQWIRKGFEMYIVVAVTVRMLQQVEFILIVAAAFGGGDLWIEWGGAKTGDCGVSRVDVTFL